jgi:basic membrane protein A
MFGIIVAPCDPTFVEQLGKDADYIFGPCQWTSDLPYHGPVFGSSEDYARLFRDTFGKEPDYHSAAASACGVTYQLALENASSLDSEKVRDALVSLDAMTFYGRIKFNEQGRDVYNPMVAVQVQVGKVVTVWPERLATSSPIYPTPTWEEREPELKVAVLHTSPIEDYGWTYEAHLGAQAMAEALPYVELSEREEACGPDAPQIMREYAEAGYEVIFCHSYNFGEYIEEVAPDYPDVIFMWGAGVEKKAPNAGIYFGRMYEARFLAGIVAGAMTKTDNIGYAAALPTSQVVRGIDAFAKGVASVNPDAKVYVEWIGEWYNPPREKEVALSLIGKGCDVITHHSDSYAPAEAAEERGVYYISFGSDMRRSAPHVFLTGAVWNWTPIMTDIVKAVHEGTWDEHPGQDWWYGLAEGGVKLAPFSDLVPDDVKEMVEEKKQAIIKGEFEVFPGMTDEELREIYYFVPNVVGELP